MITRISLLILALSFSALSNAESAVWKISNSNSYLYLAGTLHVLSEEDYPLPEEFNTAYSDASHIVFETDIDVMNAPDTSNRMMELLTYSDGSTLLDRLSLETTSQLRQYTVDVGIQLETVKLFKPGLLLSMLTFMELKTLGMDAPGVDAHFAAKAARDAKTEGALESIETQINLLTKIGDQNPELYVKYMLGDMPQLNETMTQLRSAWRKGDLATIDQSMRKSTHEQTYRSLLIERNLNWMPQLHAMLATPATEMVLVGAAHLGGSEGLLYLLEAAGFAVERL